MASANKGNNINHHHQHQHHQQQQQQNHYHPQVSYNTILMQPTSSSPSAITGNFISKDAGNYELGELDQALFLYLDGHAADPSINSDAAAAAGHQTTQRQSSEIMRPPTLNIFPSQPMHVHPSSTNCKTSTGNIIVSMDNSSKRGKTDQFLPSSGLDQPTSKNVKREGNKKGLTSSSDQEGPKTPDPKTLRRLAQNREAARKSRLRKKAYVQQLESSRIRLTQLEQELQRARSQGFFLGGGSAVGAGGDQGNSLVNNIISSDAAVFDLEYARWLDDHHRLMCELQAAVQEHIPENDLRLFVDNCLAHYDEIINLKSMIAKTDVFHLISGMWKTPAERCFMWIGGFRPSEVIKIILNQVEPVTEQQLLAICGVQQSTHEAEDALSQGLESLNQSLSETIASDALISPPNMANYMGQMALAMNKLSTIEGFVRQADHLRQQTIHRLHQLLTIRQSARCFLGIAEYFHRLRALSSLWLSRPRQQE